MQDLTIVYQGGSGGFLFYYYMLLSGRFAYGDVNADIESQFPVSLKTARHSWKHAEHWPNNQELKAIASNGRKLFLICNPLFNPSCLDDNLRICRDTTVVLLYTDLHTQLRLAYDKRAYWFTDVSKAQFNAPESNFAYMRTILRNGVNWNGEYVDPMIPKIVDQFKIFNVVKLQTLLTHKSPIIDRWLSLQSQKAIHGIN